MRGCREHSSVVRGALILSAVLMAWLGLHGADLQDVIFANPATVEEHCGEVETPGHVEAYGGLLDGNHLHVLLQKSKRPTVSVLVRPATVTPAPIVFDDFELEVTVGTSRPAFRLPPSRAPPVT